MELRAHDIVVVARQDRNAVPALPVPNANRLVIRSTDNPGQLLVEKHSPDVVQVAIQRKQTSALLPVPEFDFVVVAARNKHGLGIVEADATHGTCSPIPEVEVVTNEK